ncbi:hypothetical protein GCM10007276_13980 [Agaricicola taiwanensis]|uniref:Glucans biosynthesis glucosyltransferase H n=1 Tax=Agaricicola taiwanensis TaxID=591372 RepID=A0A8J2VQD0_9RHOB|nr:glucans biosynthesis glucosyltransferase MdoH [Agaricicola taiwanensis]GGE37789.1 hypothetical protein GCM10007276_13980 [Agaricicola taiwanensis]
MNDDGDHLVLDLPARLEAGRQEGDAKASTFLRRRIVMLALISTSFAVLLLGLVKVLGFAGWSLLDIGLLIAFALSAPWTILGFWNAVIGLTLTRLTADPLRHVAPYLAHVQGQAPVTSRTAILMTLRNEPPARALERLRIVKKSLDATGQGSYFDYFVLSDTSDAEIAAEEEHQCSLLAVEFGRDRFIYRRRSINIGYKAGNIRDFCERWGGAYDFMLPLDSDSLMSGDAVLRLVRICETNPRIGILQSLVVGTPARSGFARMFQFGMRHGMRSYTMGSAWWQGDCGPYWGHNALIRVRPFADHCDLPILPGSPPLGGYVLSHDQIEAVLMRRAGYEVWVLPEEGGSWEDNPPTLIDFNKRNLRWCQGNMQYFKLLGLPGLRPTSRVQIVLAILMYVGAAAWMSFIALGAAKAYEVTVSNEPFPVEIGLALFIGMYFMSLAPKLAGLADVLLNAHERQRYGGTLRITGGAIAEFVFAMLLAPIVSMSVALFMIGLCFGKTVVWDAQDRDDHSIPWSSAFSGLWPQTLAGLALLGAIGYAAPATLPWAAPVLLSFLLAVPFTVVSSKPAFGTWCQQHAVCAIPEELARPVEIMGLSRMAPEVAASQAA